MLRARTWEVSTDGAVHRMVVMLMNGWQARSLSVPNLILFLLSTLGCRHDLICASLVCRVIQQSSNVVYKQWIKQFRDLLLVGKVQSSLKWNPVCLLGWFLIETIFYSPDTLQVHWSNFDNVSHFLALQDTISSPSGHTCNIQKLRAVDHVVICKFCQ